MPPVVAPERPRSVGRVTDVETTVGDSGRGAKYRSREARRQRRRHARPRSDPGDDRSRVEVGHGTDAARAAAPQRRRPLTGEEIAPTPVTTTGATEPVGSFTGKASLGAM
jgi:hypothetical protein